jgi:proteic killer suppression protein
MIKTFRSKGLEELSAKGKSKAVDAKLQNRVIRRLDALQVAKRPADMGAPGFDFHPLNGKPQRYSVHVNGPWCITFGWDGDNAIDVDLEQYH